MNEWKKRIASEFIEFNPKETIKKGETAPKIAMEQLTPFTRKIKGYTNEAFKGGTKFRNGDTIMARITPCLENGKTSMVDILPNNTVGFGSTEYIIFRAIPNVSDPKFIYYLACSDEIREVAIKSMVGSSGRQRVQQSVVENIELLVPDIKEQEKIASILSVLDDKIELNNKINENLEQQAQAIFKSWFVDFEPFGGVMPSDWEVSPFGSFVTIKRGGSPRPIQEYLSNSGLKWLKISDVSALNTPYINEIKEHIKLEGLKKTVYLKAGSLVLSNSATPGIPKILDVDSCIHDGWLYFLDAQFSNEYMYLFFKHIRNNLISFGNGSVFTNLKTDILKNYETFKPSSDILNKFDSLVVPIFCKMRFLTKENLKLEHLRDTLLPKLMSGELDVSNINL